LQKVKLLGTRSQFYINPKRFSNVFCKNLNILKIPLILYNKIS